MARKPPPESQQQADLIRLFAYPEFGRFLLRLMVASDMWRSASGSDDRRLHLVEGRRSLGFDVLRWIEDAARLEHSSGLPLAAMKLVLSQDDTTTPGATDDPSDDLPDEPRR